LGRFASYAFWTLSAAAVSRRFDFDDGTTLSYFSVYFVLRQSVLLGTVVSLHAVGLEDAAQRTETRKKELTVQRGCPNTEKISQAIADHGFDGGLASAGGCFGSFCAGV
jgi:hypothetical protein